jgi:hypothetical protein
MNMIEKVFLDLNDVEISYMVWKDTVNIPTFFDGNQELDLLVKKCHKVNFESILFGNGFFKLSVRQILKKRDIEHYVKYYNGKYFHLHVYYKLRTGNHFVKEFCFNELNLFKNLYVRHGVKVINKPNELSLIIIRLAIKQSMFFSAVKKTEIIRAKELVREVDFSEINTFFVNYFSVNTDDLRQIYDKLLNDINCLEELKKLKKYFKPHKIMSKSSVYFSLFLSKVFFLTLRVKRASNKILPSKGVSVSIMGTDGSGKSTVANKISSLCSAKTSTKTIYLGGNIKTYTIKTRFYYYMYFILKIFSPLKKKFYFAWFLYGLGICCLEYGKANDRKNRVIKGQVLKNAGWIVIYERFPIVGLFDFPNKLLKYRNNDWSSRLGGIFLLKIINEIQNIIENIEKPDLEFLLTVEFETMLKRREMTDNEIIDIKNKLSVQKSYFDQYKNDILVIENNSDLDVVIEKISTNINKKLCTYNS